MASPLPNLAHLAVASIPFDALRLVGADGEPLRRARWDWDVVLRDAPDCWAVDMTVGAALRLMLELELLIRAAGARYEASHLAGYVRVEFLLLAAGVAPVSSVPTRYSLDYDRCLARRAHWIRDAGAGCRV